MYTFERAFIEYFRLKRPEFCKNNPDVPRIFTASAVALASRMWVWGSDEVPAIFYTALIGEPRTGKSSFLRHYFRLFGGTVGNIPLGSPEAVLKTIGEVKHGYMWYDEVAHLAKLLDGYMETFPNILNRAYYLDELGQKRMDQKKSVVVPAGSYFVHVYFAGTRKDWAIIDNKMRRTGFVRRTLTLHVDGVIPFFRRRVLTLEEEARRYALGKAIRKILELLTLTNIRVVMPPYLPALEVRIMKDLTDNEDRSMIEDYVYKVSAGLLVANLITFDLSENPDAWDLNELIRRMERNAIKFGLHIERDTVANPPITVDIYADKITDGEGITQYLPPNFIEVVYNMLIRNTKQKIVASSEDILDNVEKIRQWLKSGGSVVVSRTKFAQKILHTNNALSYKPTIDALVDAGYIKAVDHVYKGRSVQYIVLDPKAKICVNCIHFRTEECPRLKGVVDLKERMLKVPPWAKPCEKFELEEEPEPEVEE